MKNPLRHDGKCKDDPVRCIFACCVDAAVIVLLFTGLKYVLHREIPSGEEIVTFLAIFIPISVALKALELEYAENMARTTGWQIATTLFAVFTSGGGSIIGV
jgi:hypothetical protein